MDLSPQKITGIDWHGGQVTYWDLDDFSTSQPIATQTGLLKEDLAQVVFAHGITLDIGWYPSFDETGQFHLQLVHCGNWDEPVWQEKTANGNDLVRMMRQGAFLADKLSFLTRYHFPKDWLRWELYPDDLFIRQKALCDSDPDPTPTEHLRYGAFLWWLENPETSHSTLKRLCHLAVVDPDPHMAGSAIHGIICHASATEDLAELVSHQIALRQDRNLWGDAGQHDMLLEILAKARHKRFLNSIEHQIIDDMEKRTLSEQDLRDFYRMDDRRVMRSLVQHPDLPIDLLEALAGLKEGLLARQIRIRALEQLKRRT